MTTQIQTTEPHRSVGAQILIGGIAGMIAKSATYPLDRMKMVCQVQNSMVQSLSPSFLFQEAYVITRTQGIKSFWRGCSVALMRTVPNSAIGFFSFEYYYNVFSQITSPSLSRLFAGSCAGATCVTLLYPLDVWNTQMAVTRHTVGYNKIFKLTHIKSLYRGLTLTLIGIIPYSGMSFLTFESIKDFISKRPPVYLTEQNSIHLSNINTFIRHSQKAYVINSDTSMLQQPDRKLNSFELACCGGIAGIVSQSLVYPIDTIRKLLQASRYPPLFNQYMFPKNYTPSSTLIETIQCILSNGGIYGFYRGISLNIIKASISVGIAFSVHERLKSANLFQK